MFTLQGTNQTFKAHTCINHIHRQFFQRAVSFAVKLHKDQIPDLNYLWIIFIDQFTSGNFRLFFRSTRIQMDFRTRTTRTCITHFPEIIMFVTIDNMIGRNVFSPVRSRFVITFEVFFLGTLEYRYIQIRRIQMQYINQVFPSHINGAFLEVIAKTPVTKHFEHRMVIRVMPYFFQVIVLTAHAKTLLRIGSPARFRIPDSQDNIFPLIHSRIGKHQCRIALYYHGRRRHNLVSFRSEERFKRFTDFFCCQHNISI